LNFSGNKLISLYFALGKCYDDIGNYGVAFPHYLAGCKLKRVKLSYDPAQASRQFAGVMEIFDNATIDRLRGAGNPSQVPVFVLGIPRSGTTLTEQIIASYPGVYGAGELHDLMRIAERNIAGTAKAITFPDNLRALDRQTLTAWSTEYVSGLKQRAPATQRITDKMPANYFTVGLIHLMLPNAKIIHVYRDPVDTCLSCFTRLFNRKQEHTYDLAELGQYYVHYARLMEHWR
jgi:Sulfotransferase family